MQHPVDRASQESVGSLLADAQRVRSAAAAGSRPELSVQGGPALSRSVRPVTLRATHPIQQGRQRSNYIILRAGYHSASSSQLCSGQQ